MLPRILRFGLVGLILGVFLSAVGLSAWAQQGRDGFRWRSGLSEISDGWRTHDGDEAAWAAAGFDDSSWASVDLEDMGPVRPEWHWFRKRLHIGPELNHVRLLLQAGEGAYELYVNGQRAPAPGLSWSLGVVRPVERVFPIETADGEIQLSIRAYVPPSYHEYRLPLFLSVTIGGPTAIEYEQASLQSERLYDFIPSLFINLLLALAGVGALVLFLLQNRERDYLFLGFYLLAVSVNGVGIAQQDGVLPISANLLFSDPMTYIDAILLIEFVFSFVRRPVTWPWRMYQSALLLPLFLVPLCWFGRFSQDRYLLVESAITAPMIVLSPAVLFLWYRRGFREAGWLIFPSLLPAAIVALFDVGAAASFFGWHRLEFLVNPVMLGPIPVRPSDLGSLLFLIAIGCVMFFRFTRVSREQARSTAELEAAREIQQRLVPLALPHIPGYVVQTAYLPAHEVGGDFYQLLEQADGSTLLVLGDVSGKGLKAAMTGMLAIGALRSLAAEIQSPSALLERLSRAILETQDGGFITCICARISPGGHLQISNAGHLSPYLNGTEVPLESGLPLGITAAADYTETSLQLAPEDTLTLLSDGVVEAQGPSGELFGFDRTMALSTASATQIATAAQEFGQSDDITVLTLTVERAGVLKA
jgi:hypothetical protein